MLMPAASRSNCRRTRRIRMHLSLFWKSPANLSSCRIPRLRNELSACPVSIPHMRISPDLLAAGTHFNWYVDGSIVGVYLLATMIAGVMVRKYVGKVEDFLVAGREMNVYLAIASLAATEFGLVTCMYTAQNGYSKGFSGATVGLCTALGMFLVGATGF